MKLLIILCLTLTTSCAHYKYDGTATPIYNCQCNGYTYSSGENSYQPFIVHMDAESITEIRKSCNGYYKDSKYISLKKCYKKGLF